MSLLILEDGDNTKPISGPTALTQLYYLVSPMERESASWVDVGPNLCLSFLLRRDRLSRESWVL
jgi:hypothetical protein